MRQTTFLRNGKWVRYGLIALAASFALVLVFGAGFVTGKWSASPVNTLPSFARVNNSKSGHGAIGVIQSIQEQTITLQSRDGKLEIVLVGNDTQFDKNFEKITFGDLKVSDRIIVIGSPNEAGMIKARLIGLVNPSLPRIPGRNYPPPTGSK